MFSNSSIIVHLFARSSGKNGEQRTETREQRTVIDV